MAQYRNAVMTQNGAALLNKAQAGLCKIKFTRMSTGDGQYSESEKGIEELRKITSLKSHKQSFSFDSIKYQDDTSVELKASITNHDDTQTLSAGYYIREIAVFAQEDDKSDTEVLYSISVADVADFLPTYNGNNPILIIQKYYVTVDESRSAITVPSHYGEDLDAVKEDLEKEWKEYAKNIDEEMKKRPEKDGKADEMTVTFTEAANRENIVTGEKNSTLMGKIKKWLADLAAAAFMQVVTSYSDLMAGTALDDYLIGAAAAKEGFTELNGKLTNVYTVLYSNYFAANVTNTVELKDNFQNYKLLLFVCNNGTAQMYAPTVYPALYIKDLYDSVKNGQHLGTYPSITTFIGSTISGSFIPVADNKFKLTTGMSGTFMILGLK